ncbi:AAA domain-containing protein [Rhizobium sp. CSW-27]|uniref:AAA domain-containing protein n=1 Tax=Rhizobium sp. CSW-27 TaxID=2839985 RepID=UPI001C0383CC|nr:AAA domain-containing protein [Rhizobium sp. CSW-27]MBT9373356.1 AAA family ATPase [Rhizobium sp. CSW-27]
MYASSVRRLLEMYPAGASQEQLLWRLKSTGLRASAADILQALNELSGNGEICIIPGNRWLLSRFNDVPDSKGVSGSIGMSGHFIDDAPLLRAVRGQYSRVEVDVVSSLAEASATGAMALSGIWRELMTYYAATQRSDPRGKILQLASNHGTSWQMLSTTGDWWSNALVRVPLEDLPEAFREALVKRPERTCAIGYPLTLLDSTGGMETLPALLLPAEWEVTHDHLKIIVRSVDPVINAEWLKKVTARKRWKADDLIDRLFPEGEDRDLGAVTRRLRNVAATLGAVTLAAGKLDDIITADKEGIRNCAALFLPSDRSYTQGTASDLAAMANMPIDEAQGTAIGALLADDRLAQTDEADAPLLQLRDLTDRQFAVACDVLTKPLTVVQGPPGTGKSDVIVSVVASAVAAGQTVLFASKNHQALDEVERRLADICGDNPVVIRGRDAEGERDTNFLTELKTLAASEPVTTHSRTTDLPDFKLARALTEAKTIRRQRTRTELEIADLLDRLVRLGAPSGTTVDRKSTKRPFWRIAEWIFSLFRTDKSGKTAMFDPGKATPVEIERRLAKLQADLERLPPMPDAESLPAVNVDYLNELANDVRPLFARITSLDTTERNALVEGIKELEFSGITKARRLAAEEARLLLRHRPVWAVSTLSVPSRIPLVAGLFDLLIIDEASQCDIASALPLFFRAKRAAVVGDPMQLSFVPQLSLQQENALMDAAGLPRAGRARIAQSKNSLFDFSDWRPAKAHHFLADQFRSAPGIIDYLNEEFYGGRLAGRRDEDGLPKTPGYKAGIEWVDIKGQTTRVDDQNLNEAEAEEVARRVALLASDRTFEGTIGALSPFVGQVARIRREVDALLPEELQKRVRLKIATIDKFQGGEADVIFFSTVYTEGAPFGVTNFLAREARRFNVAVSRAKAVCVIIGDLSAARKSTISHLRRLAHHTTRPGQRRREGFDSIWEERLYNALVRRGLKPEIQYPVGHRFLDMALFHNGEKLDVEVDGRAWHVDADGNRKVSDVLRDREMKARGWKVRRFWVSEIDRNMEMCLDLIDSDLGRR